MAQTIEWFRLEDVNHAPAFFDVAKLTHIDGEYIRAMPVEAFVKACQPWLTGEAAPWPPDRFDPAMFERMAPLVQERVAMLDEVPAMVDFLFLDQPVLDADSWAKAVEGEDQAPAILRDAIAAYSDLAFNWNRDTIHAETEAIAEGVGRKLAKAQAPIRVAITGRRVGPPLFESLEVLGLERTLDRLRAALARLG